MHRCAFALVTAAIITSPAIAGDTNPPAGPVAGTMKTLDELEPRTPIQSLPGSATAIHVISAPGSYYLAGNITGEAGKTGILVDTDDVTIDLSGFALIGVPASDDGIEATATRRNISVFNGTVREWTGDGVRLTTATNSSIRDVRAYANSGHGVRLGNGGSISGGLAELNGGSGIITTGTGTISDCVARSNASHGFSPGGQSITTSCVSIANAGNGFNPGAGSVITGCMAHANDVGIRAIARVTIRDNTCDQNASSGIEVAGSDNVVQRNFLTRNTVGLTVFGSGNTVAHNTVNNNTDNYDFSAGNQLHLILSEIPESIDRACTVTLAGTLTGTSGQNGLTINADDVSIDLAGHALVGVPGSLAGIHVPGTQLNLAIRNGTVRDWGDEGIFAGLCQSFRFEHISASNNGATGIFGGDGGTISNCTSVSNTGNGITGWSGCTITHCTARENAGIYGISGVNRNTISQCTSTLNAGTGIIAANGGNISGCTSTGNTSHGISANQGAHISDCVSQGNTGNGYYSLFSSAIVISRCSAASNAENGIEILGSNATIENCSATSNNFHGISVRDGSLVLSNSCRGNGLDGVSAGIYLSSVTQGTRVESNNVTANPLGIHVDGTDNLLICNTASANTIDYDFGAGNAFGPMVVVAGIGNIATVPAAEHPWTNFSY